MDKKQKILLLIAVLVFSLLITSTTAEGFVKGTVGLKGTDDDVSDLVCGDKLCSEVDEYQAKTTSKNKHTPLGQLKLGVSLDSITCRNGLEFALKISNMNPTCLTQKTKEQLVLRGWAANDSVVDEILSEISSSDVVGRQDFEMNITQDIQNGKRFLIFEGFGWHRLHTVIITITNDQGFYTQLKSKTTDRGDLFMPWMVPESVQPDMYHIVANDGIHKFEIDVPITQP